MKSALRSSSSPANAAWKLCVRVSFPIVSTPSSSCHVPATPLKSPEPSAFRAILIAPIGPSAAHVPMMSKLRLDIAA
jgi:hypothetical protein